MSMISEPGTFRWFTQSDRYGLASGSARGDRRELRTYLEQRHAAGERWVLVMVEVLVRAPVRRSVGLAVQYRRIAPDLLADAGGRLQIADGKAEIADCRGGRVTVWASGMDLAPGQDYSEHVGFACPRPNAWDPELTAVACAN